jgi:RNA polymerase sigma-70 factor (ECF subfamily)
MTKEEFINHVEATQTSLRRFLVALCCGDAQLADDVAQESYIKAYLSCADFNNAAKFNAWIFRIAYNTFLNHRRSQRIFCDYYEVRDISAPSGADEAFRYQELYAALESLQCNERSALLLHYMQGYTVKEIAAILDASQDAVKQYLSRGRRHLRGLLATD